MPNGTYEAPCMVCGRLVRKQLRSQDGHRKSLWRCAECNSKIGAVRYAQVAPLIGAAIATAQDQMFDEDAASG